MIECERYEELISAYVDGITTEEENELIMKHIAECEHCSLLFNIYRDISVLEADDSEPPAELLSGVMAKVREINVSPKATGSKAAIIPLRWAAVAACVALVGYVGIRAIGSGAASKSADMAYVSEGARDDDTKSANSDIVYGAKVFSDTGSAGEANGEMMIKRSMIPEAASSKEMPAETEEAIADTNTCDTKSVLGSVYYDPSKLPTAEDLSADYYAVIHVSEKPDFITESTMIMGFPDGSEGAVIGKEEFEEHYSDRLSDIEYSDKEAEYCLVLYEP